MENGALYLLYLGITLLRASGELTLSSSGGAPESALRMFAQGALSNVSNPKVALFAGLLSTSIRRNPRILTRMHRVSGVVLLVLGVKLALERR